MRGSLTPPAGRTFSFDGRRLYERVPAEKKLLVYEDALSAPKSAELLARVFDPFVPEGYRAPLLTWKGTKVERVAHPRGPEAVTLREETTVDGKRLVNAWLLRWPSLDFLEHSLTADTQVTVRMTRESCDATRGLCVPVGLIETVEGQAPRRTNVKRVDLDGIAPMDDFALVAEEGEAVEKHQLVETEGGR
jgi:hypothetical protein